MECDKTNCKLPPEKCCNRRFGDFDRRLSRHERLEKHTPVPVVESSDESNTKQKITINPYDLGVEVIDTGKRGRGVRAIRSFVLNQMIMEYCGEIVTQAEMDRRMNEDYKDKYKVCTSSTKTNTQFDRLLTNKPAFLSYATVGFPPRPRENGYRRNKARFHGEICKPLMRAQLQDRTSCCRWTTSSGSICYSQNLYR